MATFFSPPPAKNGQKLRINKEANKKEKTGKITDNPSA